MAFSTGLYMNLAVSVPKQMKRNFHENEEFLKSVIRMENNKNRANYRQKSFIISPTTCFGSNKTSSGDT
jgi:hypothetical protein